MNCTQVFEHSKIFWPLRGQKSNHLGTIWCPKCLKTRKNFGRFAAGQKLQPLGYNLVSQLLENIKIFGPLRGRPKISTTWVQFAPMIHLADLRVSTFSPRTYDQISRKEGGVNHLGTLDWGSITWYSPDPACQSTILEPAQTLDLTTSPSPENF